MSAKQKRVLLTGATGFVGRAIQQRILNDGEYALNIAVRRAVEVQGAVRMVQVAGLTAETDWTDALQGVDVVVHAAARAHVMQDEEVDPLAEYRKVNVEGTLSLAQQAAAAGVKRFVFISSIGVNGNINTRPFIADDEPNPAELDAQSKWEAEQGLQALAKETGLEVVIIRPPLVYGANAPGNFGSLVRWIEKGVPLPLGAVHNKRSLVALDNLVDLIVTCLDHPAAANQVFLAGDGEDLSTSELLRGVAKAMGRPSRLLPVPAGMLQLAATLVGKKAVAQRLLGSLQVDISKTCEVLDWQPPLTVEQGLARCFVSEKNT
ncbi:MAG TPA: SDR family oxidoreductase [Thiopseudomonas sp.]|nr:SDR family oxidoreductase [Thiopseudomonas sp.]